MTGLGKCHIHGTDLFWLDGQGKECIDCIRDYHNDRLAKGLTTTPANTSRYQPGPDKDATPQES